MAAQPRRRRHGRLRLGLLRFPLLRRYLGHHRCQQGPLTRELSARLWALQADPLLDRQGMQGEEHQEA